MTREEKAKLALAAFMREWDAAMKERADGMTIDELQKATDRAWLAVVDALEKAGAR